MSGLIRKSMVAFSGVLIAISVAARQPSAHPLLSPVLVHSQAQYAGAAACKDCHLAQYEAWEKTKHSKALGKLQPADRAGGKCIKCHVTGTAEQIAECCAWLVSPAASFVHGETLIADGGVLMR